MFKTELHCHSKGVSTCARVGEQEIIERYVSAGYSTLVLTNHFSDYIYTAQGMENWEQFIDLFTSEYEKIKRAADGKLNVLLGAELRFDGAFNDYLLFGFDEKFLREHPYLYKTTVGEFHELCKERGYLLIQAHPFRNGMLVISPDKIDGVEVFNGHLGHDSRNDLACLWAEKYNLIKTSGTDFHYPNVPVNGGITTERAVQTMSELTEILKSGNYQLIKS
jgi:predicted metal-dependent phosphoesterase TrpH